MRTIAPPKRTARRSVGRGRWIVAPPTQEALERRRRQRSLSFRRRLLVGLAATAVVTAGPALVAGGAWTEVHLFVDGIVLAYVALLIELKRRSSERDAKVRHLPAYAQVPEQALRAVGERTP